MVDLTEDQVRDSSKDILGFYDSTDAISGTGQLTTFNKLGFKGISDKPDGWYLPYNKNDVAIIFEAKASKIDIRKYLFEIKKNCDIALKKYKKVIGIIYNGNEIIVLKNNIEIPVVQELQEKNIIFLCLIIILLIKKGFIH